MIIIYHHPKCKATTKCVKLLETNFGDEINIQYEPLDLTEEKLKEVLNILKCSPIDLIKIGQPIWRTLLRYLNLTDNEFIRIMVQYPILLKSPIVMNGNKAVIGRPAEKILDIF